MAYKQVQSVKVEFFYFFFKKVAEYGMSSTVGHISLPLVRPSEPAKRFYSNKLARIIDDVRNS